MSQIVEHERDEPELRFPEFDGAWERVKLKKYITKLQSGLSRLLKDSDVGIPVIRSNNIQGNQLELSDIKYWYETDTQGANINNYILNNDDILINFINSIAQIGKVAIYQNKVARKAIFTTNIMRLKTNNNTIPKFIFYIFQTEDYRAHIHAITKPAVNQASFTTVDFQKFIVSTPLLPEQEKIASFLSAVDEKIAQLEEKKNLLEDYKKGCMQQLFSQALRFKDEDGNEYPDWEEKRLFQLAERITYKNIDMSVSDVLTNSAVHGIVSQRDFFDHDVANTENLDRYTIVEVGDFIYNPRISASAPVGPIKRNNLKLGVMSPLYDVFRFSMYNTNFWTHYFSSAQWHKYMKQVANYGARHDRMAISSRDFMDMPLPFPHPDEQQKIADFLSALDDKITHAATQLEQTKTFKKGLLQKMFV